MGSEPGGAVGGGGGGRGDVISLFQRDRSLLTGRKVWV